MRTERFAFALSLAALVTALLVPARASAFCRSSTQGLAADCEIGPASCCTTGKPLYWKNACVGYSISTDAAGHPSRHIGLPALSGALRAAFGTWANATCEGGQLPSIAVSELAASKLRTVDYNKTGPNVNLIILRDDLWSHADDHNQLGLTTITFSPDSGEIFDADTEINMASGVTYAYADQVPDSAFDFQTVLTHEAGHFLGLAHSGEADSTMFAFYKPGSTSARDLSPDDVLGICTMYPSRGVRTVFFGTIAADQCDPTPRRGLATAESQPDIRYGCSAAPPGRASSGALAVGFAALGLTLVRRARRLTRRVACRPGRRRRR